MCLCHVACAGCQRVTSIRTRIKTINGCFKVYLYHSQRVTSIRTRIKTLLSRSANRFCLVRESLPSEQGLRLMKNKSILVKFGCQRVTSIRTRIKTPDALTCNSHSPRQRVTSIRTRIKTWNGGLPWLSFFCQRVTSIRTRIKTSTICFITIDLH